MAVIETIIGESNFEKCEHAIARNLLVELTQQGLLDDDFTPPSDVYIERLTPPDKTDLITVNVSFANAKYPSKDSTQVNGGYTYFIDCYANAEANEDVRGDEISGLKLLQLIRKCRAILEATEYRFLGFGVPCNITRVKVMGFDIIDNPEASSGDAKFTTLGRIMFHVTASEDSIIQTGVLAELNITKTKINRTNNGYRYEMVTP